MVSLAMEEQGVEKDLPIGLDLDQVRSERTALHPVRREEPVAESGPKSQLAKNIEAILCNPLHPHPLHIDFKKNIQALVNRCEKLPIGESLPGSTYFFHKSKYMFSSESEQPIVVMKSSEELEAERESRKGMVPFRYDSELTQLVKEGLKRAKKSKNKNTTSSKPVEEVDDFDMFGGFTAQTSQPHSTELTGPLFEPSEEAHAMDNDLDLVREALRSRTAKVSPKPIHDEEESWEVRFGEKLDISKFRHVETEEEEPRTKKRKDNQIFQKVMHKLDTK
jgi:hypothetical protein